MRSVFGIYPRVNIMETATTLAWFGIKFAAYKGIHPVSISQNAASISPNSASISRTKLRFHQTQPRFDNTQPQFQQTYALCMTDMY